LTKWVETNIATESLK